MWAATIPIPVRSAISKLDLYVAIYHLFSGELTCDVLMNFKDKNP
jgi:hypothetical protein